MRFLNGLLIIAVVAFMTACGGGAKTNNTEGTDTTANETANADNTEKKNDETSSTETAKMPKDMLTQKWSFDADAILAAMMETATEEEKKGMTDKMKEAMKKEMSQETMEFKADGTYINIDAKGKEEKGTWTLSEDGKTLTTKEEGKDKDVVITLTELTAEKVVAEMKSGDKTTKLIMKPFTGESTSTEGTTDNKDGEKKEGEKTEDKK